MLPVCMLLLSVAAFSQTATPVAVTGYNADVIADGATVAASVTADVDGGGYYFINKAFTGYTPTMGLPVSGTLSSISSPNINFLVPDGTTNNSLRLLAAGSSGTLKLVTSRAAGTIYLMGAAGNGPVSISAKVYFEDGSWQTISSASVPDWFNVTTNNVIIGIGRVKTTSTAVEGTSTDPRLLYIPLTINPLYYGLKIDSINISKPGTTGIANIMGVSFAAPCVAPTAQPTALNLTSSTSTITGSFTAASPAPNSYLVVRYPTGSTPTAPVNNTTYTAGQLLGTGTVVQVSPATTFTVTGLTANTGYDFYIYSVNNDCVGGPLYNTATPLTGTVTTKTCGTFTGTFSVGPTGNYPSITVALQALNNGLSGPVIFELQSTYVSTVETFPIVLNYSGCYTAANNVTIRPAAGANGLTIIDTAKGGPAFYFNGANYFTIDGRPGGVSSAITATPAGSYNSVNLNIVDTTATGQAIRIDNGAYNNVIKYCDVQGRNTTDAEKPTSVAGVIYFGNGGAVGNDNNTIDHCNIHSTGTGANKPSIGVYSQGYDNSAGTVAAYVAQFNDNNTLSNNNIYDFFSASRSAGVELNAGNEGWTINGNSFFQTADITTSDYNRAIWIVPAKTGTGGVGNGFSIVNNYIGGKAPNCGGGAYTFLSGTSGYFQPMEFEVKDAATPGAPSSIQGNVITNISVTSSTTNNPFDAIFLTNGSGNINIGNITGNVIGSVTGTNGQADGGITVATSGTTATNTGINIGGTYTVNVANNKIGNLLFTGANNNIAGILVGGSITGVFNNNLITNISATSTTGATTTKFVNGIQANTSSPVLTITNNIVQNIKCNYASASSNTQVVGINVGVTTANVSGGITGNTVRNLSSASQTTGTTTSSALIGICMNSTAAAGFNVSNNVIDSLVAAGTSTTAAVNVLGLYVNGTTSVNGTVAKNFIHTLDVTAANTAAIVTGIQFNAGTATFSNNMIRLGIRPDGTANTTALTYNGILSASTGATNYYHNSVYIGGSGVGNTATNTFAFRRSATSGTYDVRDNIFANTRANASSGGKHYAVFLTSAVTGFSSNYNLYQYNGTGGVFANNGTLDVAIYNNSGAATPGWIATDINSLTGSPNFINAAGAVSAVNLHINTTGASAAEGTGTAIAAVTDDIDGETRSGLTPTDIGADAGNFTAATTCATPGTPTNLVLTPAAMARINGSFTAPASGASGYIVVRYAHGATPVAPADGVVYNIGGILGTGTIVMLGNTTSFIDSGLVANTTYDYYVYSYNTGCLGEPKYSTSLTGTQTTSNCAGPAGLITVGPTGNYPTLTAALASLSSGISGAVTVELQNDYTPTYATSNETFPIVIGSNSCFSTTNTVTIRPAANASGLVISSANAGPTFDLAGGDYVTIDGRPGGVGSSIGVTASGSTNTTNLNIINTNTTSGAAIRFDNGASFNTIKYCDLQGQNNTTDGNLPGIMGGVVYFGNNGVTGNDNNRIDNCNIHAAGTGTNLPTMGVYALGAANNGLNANFNDADTISNCNIYDFFHASKNSWGIALTQGVNNWVVTGNSLFQTASRATTTSGAYNKGIWVFTRANSTSVGNGFIITNNYIGGSTPQAGGTPYTFTAYTNTFDGIRVELADGLTPNASTIQGNVITNINIGGSSTTAPFEGIMVTNTSGNVNVIGNTIGATTGNDAIKIAAGASTTVFSTGILVSPGAVQSVINVRNNNVGSITTTNNGNSFAAFFSNAAGNMILDGNLFGSLTTANSIQATNTGTTMQFVRGISVGTAGGFYSITNNTIANLTNNTASSTQGAQTAGIVLATSGTWTASVIGNNTVRHLYCSAAFTQGSTNSVLAGIALAPTQTTPIMVTGNTVHSLTTGAATATVFMEGIFFSGVAASANNIISKNIVHSFNVSTTNANANFRGIELNGGGGLIANNMVRLGIRPDGTSLTNPIRIDAFMVGGGASTANANVYNNSAYIGGTGVGTTANYTTAFHKEITVTTTDLRNNIFINNRSNATTGGNHFAVNVSATTGVTFGNNIYGYGGTGGAFASTSNSNTVANAAYSATWIGTNDNNSQVTDPGFVDPTGPATSVDLHITASSFSPANGAAAPVAQVTDDIDGEMRDAVTPDVGADEFTQSNGIDMQAVSMVAPASAKGCYSKEQVTIKVRNNSSIDIDFSVNPVTLTVNVSGATTATISTVLNTGTLAAGTTKDVAIPGAANLVDMSAMGTYIFNAKTSVAGDIKLSNDTMVTDTRIKVALAAGSISVSANTFCLTGMPTLTNANSNGYDTIRWQRSATLGTGYGNIPNAIGASYKDTINATSYYRLMATCATDTLYTPEIEVIVRTPQVTSTTPASRCDDGRVTLAAIGSALSSLTWYADSTGGTAITIGGSYATPVLSATDTFYVSATESGCESKRMPVIATINHTISIVSQPVGQIVCPGTSVTFSVTATGTNRTYQWQKDGVNISGAVDSFYTIAASAPADNGNYTVVINGTCGSVFSSVAALSVAATNSWVGTVSSDWNTAANWCGGVPGTTSDVTIIAGTPYSPVVSGTGNVHSLTISRGATVTVAANGTLNMYGDYINNNGTLSAATGTIAFRGTAAQNIASLTAGNVIVNSAGVNLAGNMTVMSNLTLTSGHITLGVYNLYLYHGAAGSMASHIVTNSSGSVLLPNVTAAVTVPVGFSATEYNPVTLSNGQGLTYTVRVADGVIAAMADNNKSVNRTWTVTTTTIPASPVTITFQYADTEANPGCNPAGVMDAGVFNGITYALANTSGGLTPVGSPAARLVTLSTTQLGSYVLANQGAIHVTVDQFKVQLLPTVIRGGSATLRISTPRTMRMEWMVTDMAGQLVKKFNTVATPGVNDIPVSLPGLANGIYQLRATSDDGKLPTIRFMIHH